MYLTGKGADIEGPGTSLVQRINWTPLQERQNNGGLGCACSHGLGLFDSMDFTSWGMGEWGVVAVGGYLILSLAGDASRGSHRVRRSLRRRRRVTTEDARRN
jgi:hypothetical protein